MSISENIVQQAMQLAQHVIDPLMECDLLALNSIDHVHYQDSRLSLSLTLPYPGEGAHKILAQQLNDQLMTIPDVETVSIDLAWQVQSTQNSNRHALTGVTHVIAVASGKGGVGKSTTTANLALAMAQLGARVGIVDADIYGPSQPQMLGVADRRPEVLNEKMMVPVDAHGLQTISMGYLLSDRTPAVWRGPMATGALQQLLFQTAWEAVDYLFVDMPPGTGDIHLTLSQQVPLSGAVIVTTPQDIALLDAKKAIEMFAKVSVPVLGIVENMSVHQCSQCGHKEPIFGVGGGERIAKDYGVPLLGTLPLALSIREQADSGRPTVIAEPDSETAQDYRFIAQKTAVMLAKQQLSAENPTEIIISDD